MKKGNFLLGHVKILYLVQKHNIAYVLLKQKKPPMVASIE